MSDGQVTSQVCCVFSGIVTEAVNVLSTENNSAVSLETVAVLETAAPAGAAESTWKTNTNCAVVLGGKEGMVQTTLPVPPTDGLVQVAAGPVTCVSDWNVALVATVTSSRTFSAAFGPLLVKNTVKGALEPADTSNGAKMGVQRSTVSKSGSCTMNLALACPLFDASMVFTVHVPV